MISGWRKLISLLNDWSLNTDAGKHGHQIVEIEKLINLFDFRYQCIYLSFFEIGDTPQI